MPQSEEKQKMDRMIMQEAVATVRHMVPHTEFILLGVEPDGTPNGYYLKVVTSIDPDVSIKVLERALKAARANIETFRANAGKLDP